MTKAKTLEILADYFIEKGKILTKKEYMSYEDTPIRPVLVARSIGSWARLPEMIAKNFPAKFDKIGNSEYAKASRAADKASLEANELVAELKAEEVELELLKEKLVTYEKNLTELKAEIGKKSTTVKELAEKSTKAVKFAADLGEAANKLLKGAVEEDNEEDLGDEDE